MAELDSKLRALLDLIASIGEPPLHKQTVAEFRVRRERGRELVNLPAPDIAVVRDLELDGAAGRLKARIFDVEDGAARPTLIYFHGGGFVYGSIESHDPVCRRLAAAGEMRLISVEYRLAPEHPFPAGIEDAIAATASIVAESSAYGVDAKRIAVGGDSAGACLATLVARHMARTGGPMIAFQLLIYPVVQAGEITESRKRFAEGYFLTKEAMDWFENFYLPAGIDKELERVSPLRTPPPKGLAPALIITAGFDPLLDEGRAYAEALTAAGCAARYVDYPDQIHGFFNFTAFSSVAASAIDDAARAVRAALG
jgi:acetyl esterase